MTKKILIVTDAWYPQVNGVVRVFEKIKTILEKRGFTVIIIHPELFKSVPFPLYPEVPIVLSPKRKFKDIFEKERPDYVHIGTEWILGFSARSYCLNNNIPFTTSYQNLAGFLTEVGQMERIFATRFNSLQSKPGSSGTVAIQGQSEFLIYTAKP